MLLSELHDHVHDLCLIVHADCTGHTLGYFGVYLYTEHHADFTPTCTQSMHMQE